MKTTKNLLLCCLLTIIISSCQDGNLGVSKFIITNASGNASNFYTTDPNIPYPSAFNVNYTTEEGEYSCTYYWGAIAYFLTYTIIQEEGETWNGFTNGFLTQPNSGNNRQYTFDCDAPSGEELSWRIINNGQPKEVIINKTVHCNGGKIIIKGKGVYDPSHTLLPVQKNN